MKHIPLGILCLALGTTALAHEGVKNPAVMKRMHGMKEIGSDLKVLVQMAKGETLFDQSVAQAAAASIATRAVEAPELFEAKEDDPKSEALPAIWNNFDDFTAKSKALEKVALRAITSMATLEELRPALQEIGAACTQCHRTYRERR